ncbi:MAG: hypothetical protein KC501_29040 [Myxococcales bacterium]|nr:hypothetical protein [Myxococcales bacterium]
MSWCSPDGRIVVRCFGDAPEGPFGLRSVARVDADGVGFSRVDEDTEAGAIALQLERVRMLPDGARRELTVEWEDPSAGPSQVAMSLVREQLVVRSETRDHGMLSSDERCLAEQGAHLCTRRSFEGSGELYRTLHIYERPRLCLEASLDTWKDGAPQWVYVDRGRGPLATLLEQAHAAWGGPPSPDEHELVVLSWKDAPPGDEPGLELRILREDAPCDGPAAGTLARGELVGEQLCFETCDTSVFGQCVDRGCRPLSPDLRERLLADARREAEQRLAPLLDADGS